MPFFSGAQNVEINGGHFEEHHNNQTLNTHNGPPGIDILRKASNPEAAHDGPRTYVPRCLPGTREQSVGDLVHWAVPALGDTTPSPIYWMRGPAGVGKTAVAQTCAEKLQVLGRLGATFFFSASRENEPAGFFPSIAYQLSTTYPAYRDLINARISYDETIITKALSFQFQYLIKKPLQELGEQGKGIGKRIAVVVDGLDECTEIETQREIIRIVAAAVSDGTFPLCWAFFSRPDSHIEAMFSSPLVSPYCHKVILPLSSDAEIELYLRSRFETILLHCLTSAHPAWPSVEDMESLIRATDGSFIYATTVARYVEKGGVPGPQERLCRIIEVILDRRKHDPHSDTNTDAPFAELDAFYKKIMRRIPENILPSIHLLLALVCRRRASGAIITANLLGLSKSKFEALCSHANSFVRLTDTGKSIEHDSAIDTSRSFTQTSPNTVAKLSDQIYHHLGGEISFYHKSFSDFLLDPTRSGSYCVRNSEDLARHFTKIHLDYDRSFCWRRSELVLAPNVTDSASTLSYPSTNELVNSLIKACVYRTLDSENSETFSASGEVGLDAACDFRKHLHIVTHFTRMLLPDPSRPSRSLLWGCECRVKCLPGAYIACISRTGFSKFKVLDFKRMIKQRQQANIIQPHSSGLASQFKSLFYNKSSEHVESVVFRIGHGEKSTFWYWEINYELRHYREFRSVDLATGKKAYQGENFDSWPWY